MDVVYYKNPEKDFYKSIQALLHGNDDFLQNIKQGQVFHFASADDVAILITLLCHTQGMDDEQTIEIGIFRCLVSYHRQRQ